MNSLRSTRSLTAAVPAARPFALRTSFRPSHSRDAFPYRRILGSQARWESSSTNSDAKSKSIEGLDKAGSSGKSDTAAKPPSSSRRESAGGKYNLYGDDWEDTVDFTIKTFAELPHELFGVNQHMLINYELKEALRIMLRQFNAPIVYCFAYGSGVFPQEDSSRSITEAQFRAVHPKPPEALVKAQKGAPKMIDFIFGVTHTQHWHSINMRQHRNHYSSAASLGSGFVSRVQNWGAGVYFNPYIEVNGMLIKYGVTSIDSLVHDLSTWNNLYLAGRLHKPVKILRDHPQVRLANQYNLMSAIRTALLLLPPQFTEEELYSTISGLSYLGDPRMALPTENRNKVNNIVQNNMVHFRRLYAPLIKALPNVSFRGPCRLDDEEWVLDPRSNNGVEQDMDPVKRSNMVRRLPDNFRKRLYFQYQKKFAIPREDFNKMIKESEGEGTGNFKKRQGGDFEKRIVNDDPKAQREIVRRVISQTVNWPSTVQSLKGLVTSGVRRTARYLGEKMAKWNKGRRQTTATAKTEVKDTPEKTGKAE
ncbi:hypothetical protein S40288_01600 [Stachybotrys chartarum IBT 40288]|nr:hypothetical protein S40288_01600 [Stachybotrys chartarum IBT 40288]